MRKSVLLAVLIAAVAATMSVSPALAQLAGGPPPPESRVTEDGTLISGGDMRGPCSEVGIADETLDRATPEVRAEAEQVSREAIRACQAAGFDTAGDLPASASASNGASSFSSASASPASSAAANTSASPSASDEGGGELPETGGPAPLLLAGLLLFLVGGGLVALRGTR